MEEIKKNRKQRRFEAKLARSKKQRKNLGVGYWVKRLVKEMQDNPQVQKKVLSGELDKYLG